MVLSLLMSISKILKSTANNQCHIQRNMTYKEQKEKVRYNQKEGKITIEEYDQLKGK